MEILTRCSNASQAFLYWINDWCSDRRDRQALLAVSCAVAFSVVYKFMNSRALRRKLERKRKEKQSQQRKDILKLRDRLNSV